MLFVECLKQHTKDRRLMDEHGCHNGQEWGCDPYEVEEKAGYGITLYSEPHPLFLGGRSPHYWICGEWCLLW